MKTSWLILGGLAALVYMNRNKITAERTPPPAAQGITFGEPAPVSTQVRPGGSVYSGASSGSVFDEGGPTLYAGGSATFDESAGGVVLESRQAPGVILPQSLSLTHGVVFGPTWRDMHPEEYL